MARAPFKLRSGNTTAFKNLGSSPAKQGKHFLEKKTTIPMEQNYIPTSSPKKNNKNKELEPVTNDAQGSENPTIKRKTTKGPIMPKNHTVTPPTDKKSKESKGTVKGLTQFQYDAIPVTNTLKTIGQGLKKVGKIAKDVYIDKPIETVKKVKKYFTEK